MEQAPPKTKGSDAGDRELEALGHPRGTLAIVVLFGILFGLGWFAMYVYGYLARGATH